MMRARLRWGHLGVLVLALFSLDCARKAADSTDKEASESTPEQSTALPEARAQVVGVAVDAEVSYQLAFKWGPRAVRDGDAFTVTTDLGFKVRAGRGFVHNYSTELVECEATGAAERYEPSPLEHLHRIVIGATNAYAGHSNELNPIGIEEPRVEALTPAVDHGIGGRPLTGLKYCQVHFLIARANHRTLDLPADGVMDRQSLFLELQITAPDGSVSQRTLTTQSAYGKLRPITAGDGSAFEFLAKSESATVKLTRNLETMFDGIDFNTASDKVVALTVLKHLVEDMVVTVEVK